MERRFSALSSRGAWLVTSLILAGCSADPGARQTVADTTQTPAAKNQATPATPTTSATAAPPAAPSQESPVPKANSLATSSPVPRPTPSVVAPAAPAAVPSIKAVVVQPVVAEAATPKPVAKEATAPPATPAKVAPTTIADPGGVVEVAATKPGLTRIGAGKCKLCHQVQFASWAKTAHAARVPPLDCESCHGAGSEYKTLPIMKDPKKARAAGMVNPEISFCSKCHTSGVTADLLKKAHAHKTGA